MGIKKELNHDFISDNWDDFIKYVIDHHYDLLGDILAAAYDREAVSSYINGLLLSAAADFQEYKRGLNHE